MAKHIEHPGSLHSKPASLKILSIFSSSACCFTRPEPGTTIALTCSATFLPFTILAEISDFDTLITDCGNNLSDSCPSENIEISFISVLQRTLINELLLLDSEAYNEDYHISKRRLMRSIEIISDKSNIDMKQQGNNILENSLVLGIRIDRPIILSKIKERLNERLEEGMIEEVESLLASGLNFNRLAYFGLEYKFIGQYLSKKIDYDTMKEMLNNAINKFSKRQMTFFRRMEKRGIKINWIDTTDLNEIYMLTNSFLQSPL